MTIDGGGGDDTMDGGDAAEMFIGGIRSTTRSTATAATTRAWLGAGADIFRWDPGDGSDIVEGEFGFDTLDFNGADVAEKMSLSPNGSARSSSVTSPTSAWTWTGSRRST